MKVFKNTHNFLNFTRKNNNNEPITTTPTEIYFSVKENYDDERYLIQKTMTNGDIVSQGNGEWQIRLLPSDTAKLAFGKYYCDVKVIDEFGLNFIVVAPQVFEILDTVTLTGG